jgi:hypothetical protein
MAPFARAHGVLATSWITSLRSFALGVKDFGPQMLENITELTQ